MLTDEVDDVDGVDDVDDECEIMDFFSVTFRGFLIGLTGFSVCAFFAEISFFNSSFSLISFLTKMAVFSVCDFIS